jgi:hypothetical protein
MVSLPPAVIASRLVDDLGLVNADPAQLEQVIMNLAVNARGRDRGFSGARAADRSGPGGPRRVTDPMTRCVFSKERRSMVSWRCSETPFSGLK